MTANTNGVKLIPTSMKPSRGCFGGGLFKGDEHSNMIKYKSIAEAETARADANAEEIAVLRDTMMKLQGGEAAVDDSELRVKNSELSAKVDEQEEDIKKLKEALTVASTALESEEAAKVASRATALAAMDDLKSENDALKAGGAAPNAEGGAALSKALEDLQAENATLKEQNEALKAATGTMTHEQSAEEARKKVEAVLAKQALQFDGAGNKNTQQSPLGVPQSWKLESLDAKKKASNAKTLELLYDVLKQYPELYVQCHGETDADANKPADAVLAKFFGFNTMQPIQDRLAENRAAAVQDALVSHGIPADRVVVTFKGCGGQSKVGIVPMPASVALQKMRGNLMRQHTVDLQKISQMDALNAELKQAKDDLLAEQSKSKATPAAAAAVATAPPAVVDTAALDTKQRELEEEKAQNAALKAELAAAKRAELQSAAAATAATQAKDAAAAALEAEKQKQVGDRVTADKAKEAQIDADKAATQAALDAEKQKEAALQVELEAEKASAKSAQEKATAELQAEKAKEARLGAEKAATLTAGAQLLAEATAEADQLREQATLKAPGVLRVKVISAAGILSADANGMSDPFAKVYLGAQPEVVRKTNVVRKTLEPNWDEQFDFHGTLAEMTAAPLEIELNDSDVGGLFKQELGRASLPFGKEVVEGKNFEGALNTQGTVKLFASFAPLKLVLSSDMYVKKRGVASARYTKHHCTLSYAQGFDGWTAYRLAYHDSHDVEHAATVVGKGDEAPMRYEFTIITHENQGYSVRCSTNAEFTQWTDAIKVIVPPPLSHGHAEEAVAADAAPKKKSSLFSRRSSKKDAAK